MRKRRKQIVEEKFYQPWDVLARKTIKLTNQHAIWVIIKTEMKILVLVNFKEQNRSPNINDNFMKKNTL